MGRVREMAGSLSPARWVPVLAGVLLATGCGGNPISGVGSDGESTKERLAALEEDTSGVLATIQAFNEAFDARDASRFTTLFTEVAEVYLFDGRVVQGRHLARALVPVWRDWSNLHSRTKLGGVKLARPYGWAKYTQTLSFTDGGRERTLTYLVTMTFERRGRTWLITHLHLSSAGQTPES